MLNYTENLEKLEKNPLEKTQKIQRRNFPEIADFCPLSWSNVFRQIAKQICNGNFCNSFQQQESGARNGYRKGMVVQFWGHEFRKIRQGRKNVHHHHHHHHHHHRKKCFGQLKKILGLKEKEPGQCTNYHIYLILPPKSFLNGPHSFGKERFLTGTGWCMVSFSQLCRSRNVQTYEGVQQVRTDQGPRKQQQKPHLRVTTFTWPLRSPEAPPQQAARNNFGLVLWAHLCNASDAYLGI